MNGTALPASRTGGAVAPLASATPRPATNAPAATATMIFRTPASPS